MIKFIIPGLYEQNKININLLYLLKNKPEYFYDNTSIGAVFGSFHYNIWDGGRIFGKYTQASREEIIKLKQIYNDIFQVPMRFVFTNCLISEEDCHDRFNNMVLEICHNELNEIVVSSPILYNYIKSHYPKYKFISSTTKCLSNKEEALKEIEKEEYYMICIDYNLNKNENFLNSIPKNQYDKVEFLINAICPPGCSTRKQHYKMNSLYHLNYGKEYPLPTCSIYTCTLNPELEKGNNLSSEEVQAYYQKGFTNFKIEGRTLSDIEIALNYSKYMAKPEYKELVVYSLLNLNAEELIKL